MTIFQIWDTVTVPNQGGQHSDAFHLLLQEVVSGTASMKESVTIERTSSHIRRLLMLAGDVESNPGPDPQTTEDSLITGLADLVGQAPASMREVLCVWSPQKPTNVIATELGNRKFTVAVLQLHWPGSLIKMLVIL